MKRLLFTLMAIIFAIQGWTQTLNEGFEGTTFPPEDWTKVTTQGTVSWNRYTSSSPRGTACASVNYQSPNHTNYLITPKLSVTTGLDTISFWIKCPTQYSGTTFSIMVSTTDNAVSSFGATSLYSLVSASSGGGITTTWIKHSVALTDYIGQNIYIAFKVVDADGLRVMLDDVTGPNLFVPSCLKPSILSYSNIGALSADVSWTETGTASQWTIEYKPSSDTSWVNAISNTASSTTFNLTNLTGNTSYNVRVKAVCISGTDESDWRIGSFTTPYSCPQPTSLAVPSANITTTDALVSWSPTINPVNWNEGYLLQYKPSSVTDWNLATSVTAIQDTFYLIQGLNPSTGYSIRLKSVCNPGVDSSSWTNTVNFTTLCVPINTFPWAESFEGLTAANTLPNNCWTATNLGLKTGTQNTNFNSYNRNSHTGTGAAFFVWGCNDSFKTPSFQFAANTSYDFSFWYVTDGLSGWNTLRAELWDATTNTLVDTLGSQVNNPTNTNYLLYTSSFTVPNENDSYYVSIYCQSTSAPWYLTIDDISVEASPTCPSAYNLTSTLRSSTSVDLNWMQNGNGSGWVIAYGDTTAFDPSTATQTVTISGTDPVPYTLTGLNPQTPYSFAVRQNCTNGAWSNIVSVITPATAATLPYSQNFEDATENNAWSFINGTQTNQWVIGTAADTLGTNGLYVSNDLGVTNAYTVGTSRVYAYRDFEVPAGAGELELSFDWRAQGGSAYSDFLRMYLVPLDANITAGVIPPNGLDQSAQIGNYTGGTGEHWLSQSTVWQHKTMRINSLQFPNLAGRTWRLLVHWKNESSTTTGIQPPAAVDNINLSVVACATPSALAASNITTTSALLTWTENGSATDWIIEYKPSSSTTWSTYQTTSNPDSIINLVPGTSYTARLRSLCSDTSLYSNSITFQTVCAAQAVPTPVEGFLTAVPPTTCWSEMQGILPATGNATLTSTTSGWYWNTNVTPHNAKVNIYSTGCNYWLISPSVDLGDGTSPAQIEFDVFYTAYNSTNAANTSGTDDRFAVVVSTDDGLTWNAANATIWSNATGATRVLNNIPNTPTHIILPLFDPATTLPYTGNIKVGFYGESTASNADNDLHIDNFEVLPYTTCQRPTSVMASNITSTDATVNFTENGSSTSWEYVYGDATTITDPTTGTAIATTTNSIQLTGLTPQTQYNIWVRSICDNGNSEWSAISTFVTEALPATLPYTCDFESSTENLAWKSLSNGVNKWAIGTAAGNGNSTTGTQANYISNDNGVSYAMNYGSIYAYSYRDIDFGTDPASYNLLFDWKCQGYQSTWDNSIYAGLRVYLRDPSEVISTSGLPTNPDNNLGTFVNASTWQNAQLPIDNVSGVKRLIFFYFDPYYNYAPPAAIDNISLTQATCPRPASVVASNLTTTTAEISWVHPGADSYIVSYRTNTTGSTYTDDAATTSPYTIQGLTLGTQYFVTVRAICGSDTTIYSSISTFQTPCVDAAINQYPYIDDFTSGIGCWLSLSSGTSANGFWQSATSGSYPTTTPHSPSNMLYFNSYNTSATGYLISSEFDIPASTPMAIDFWMVRDGGYSSYNEYVEILVNSTQSITGATSLGIVHRPLGMSPIETVAGWHEYLFTVPDSITGSRYFIIKAQGAAGNNMFVDDFSVDAAVTVPCPDPTSVLVQNVTTTTADVSWTAGGSETSWEVRLGTTGTPVSVTSPTYPLTGLTSGTNYTVYVRANCGTGYSAWVASAPFTTTSVLTVVTLPQTSVNQTSATLHGTVTPGSATILSQGFEWKATSATTWTVESAAGTTITHTLTTLIANTSYTYRAFAMTSTDTVRGVDISFTTLPIVPPTVVTSPVTNIQATTATFNGTVAQGTDPINGRGFEYKLTSTSTWTGALDITATGTTAITASPTGLTANTQYDVRAYVIIGTTKTYGNVVNFITLQNTVTPPTVVTSPVSNLTQTSVTLNGTVTQGAESITSQGFEWKEASQTTWIRVPIIGTLTYNLPGLTANTAYQCRAYAQTPSASYTYGATVNFTTLPIVPPTVVTSPVSNLAPTSVTLNGTVTQGTNPILTKGFEWRPINTTTWIRVPVTGTLTYNLPGLTASTTYEYRAYATTAIDTTNGLVVNFTTLPMPVVLGDVRTLEATDSAAHSATLNGILVNVGNALSNIKVGFVYSTMSNPMIGGTNVITDTVPYIVGMTSFNKSIVGLQSNTSYFFKAYVTNSAGTKYGEEKTFITLGLENPQAESFSVSMYPNPATNTTKLVVSGVVGEANIVISDVQGRIINTINAKSVNGVIEQTIDVNNLAKGVYYVRIQNSTTSRTQKLIVQ